MIGEYKLNEIYNEDSLECLKTFKDYEFDINYSDPPYALGSEVIVRPDGKVDYKKANDFMNKWEMPTGTYWEQWFIEAYRTLKHGGYLIMFGMDRQLLLFKYYANLAGFTEQQSLYWYFISNFPKATNLSLQIDKNAGVQGQRGIGGFNVSGKGEQDNRKAKLHIGSNTDGSKQEAYNDAKTDLAKKYNGYKYSISPLKQTNETIMVFQKPYKTGSCLHDTLAYENGDDTCCCGALDIDGNRVGTESRVNQFAGNKNGYTLGDDRSEKGSGFWKQDNQGETETTGRYPSQTFCGGTNLTIMVLDDTIDLETKNEIRSCYDELYLQSLREKVLSITVKSEEWQGEVLHKDLLLSGSESDNERKKSPKLWKKENTRNDSEIKKDLGIEKQEQRIFSELEGWNNKVEGLHSGRLSELPEELLENIRTDDNERQQKNIATQNCDGNTFKQNTRQEGNNSSQKRSETRQQSGELGDLQPSRTQSYTQESRKENERTRVADRTFTERDTFVEKEFIPKKWLKHFSYACNILVSTAEVLDKQSGISKSSTLEPHHKTTTAGWGNGKTLTQTNKVYGGDTGGCSRILHKCDFEENEHDLYFYNPKVSKSERNAGCDELDEKLSASSEFRPNHLEKALNGEDGNPYGRWKPLKNNHPTLKPIKLNERILKLFKTPNEQKIIYPFAGSGSEIIGGIKAGFTNWVGCEINPDYVEIAKARIDYWSNKFDDDLAEIVVEKEIDKSQVSLFDLMED